MVLELDVEDQKDKNIFFWYVELLMHTVRVPEDLKISKSTVYKFLSMDDGCPIEYCFHGNLRDYVTRHREYFINELDPVTQELQARGGHTIVMVLSG